MDALNSTQLLRDNTGVSTVVGVILMVGVTVVLAGVIGAFVFGVGEELNKSEPQTNINFVYSDSGSVTVYHDGGEILKDGNTGRLTITGDYSSDDGDWGAGYDDDGMKKAKDSTEIGDMIWSMDGVNSGEEIVVNWVSNDGDTSAKLGSFKVP